MSGTGTVTILNWSGKDDSGSKGDPDDKLKFVTVPTDVSQIQFKDPFINGVQETGTYTAGINGDKIFANELIVPEPNTLAGGAVLCAFIGVHFWRQRKFQRESGEPPGADRGA